ncbi:MAG: DUF177 domain-containing protein [Candidatus Orphnella occulta]|nr:DUF177 domain-containing protein [Candidatus Orphnella occulta]
MKICVKEIMQDGLDIEKDISPEELCLDSEEANIVSNVKVKAHVEKEKDVVIVFCDIRANEECICSRCLKDFNLSFKKREDFVYTLTGEHTIELNGDIKDTIMLDQPIRQLCRVDCKGICTCCGKDLNDGPCNCKGEREKICRD